MSELYKTKPIPGFYILADTSTRTNVVAYFDGNWWLPGSDIAFEAKDVAMPGEHHGGRFNCLGKVYEGGGAYGDWEVTNGRFR